MQKIYIRPPILETGAEFNLSLVPSTLTRQFFYHVKIFDQAVVYWNYLKNQFNPNNTIMIMSYLI